MDQGRPLHRPRPLARVVSSQPLQWCERLLRIPPDPEPPPGDEASARVFRAAPIFYKYLLVLWGLRSLGMLILAALVMLPPTAAAIALSRKGQSSSWLLLLIPALVLPLVVGLRLLALAILRLDFEKRWYLVTDRSLRVREGILTVREMTVTFANIQNISVSQGPLQRLLGIADLRVDTAGGGGARGEKGQSGPNMHTAWFRGVDNANEVREVIQQRLRLWKDAGLGDHEDLAATRRVAAGPSPELIAALHEVHVETCALRQSAARRFA